jgi:hypothetical protein
MRNAVLVRRREGVEGRADRANGLLFAFAEDNYAQGMKTAETTLEKIDVT